jgi:hypothetical protein
MNFYQLYNILNEYGQNLIETLTKKFQSESPGLSSTTIAGYIDKFDRIKNNLPNKDINTYSWKELEEAVDGYGGSKRIKAGKLDTNTADPNLLYNQNKIKIYLGKNRNSCIRYGEGYTFCISARGKDSIYGHYRIDKQGTPYFIFNENLPHNDNRHLIVLFVYNASLMNIVSRYSITLADNMGDKNYNTLERIIKDYPWIKPIANFVEDDNSGVAAKGHVDAEPLEHILYLLERDFWKDVREKFNFFSAGGHTVPSGLPTELAAKESVWIYENAARDMIKESSPNDLQRLLQNDLKPATAYVYSINKFKKNHKELLMNLKSGEHKREEYFLEPAKMPGMGEYRRFNPCDNISFLYNKPSELIKNIKKVVKDTLEYLNEYESHGDEPLYSEETIQEILNRVENYKEDFIQKLNDNKEVPLHEIKTSKNIKELNPVYIPYFAIHLFSPKKIILDMIDKNKNVFNKLNEIKRKHNKQVSWLKNLSDEKLNNILKDYSSNKNKYISDVVTMYMNNSNA